MQVDLPLKLVFDHKLISQVRNMSLYMIKDPSQNFILGIDALTSRFLIYHAENGQKLKPIVMHLVNVC